jgi:hypothetical protein
VLRIGAQPVGEDRSGRAGTHHDIVEDLAFHVEPVVLSLRRMQRQHRARCIVILRYRTTRGKKRARAKQANKTGLIQHQDPPARVRERDPDRHGRAQTPGRSLHHGHDSRAKTSQRRADKKRRGARHVGHLFRQDAHGLDMRGEGSLWALVPRYQRSSNPSPSSGESANRRSLARSGSTATYKCAFTARVAPASQCGRNGRRQEANAGGDAGHPISPLSV